MQLSNDAKMAYALLKDRLELSIKNNWFDENGDIFFHLHKRKLKTILNCHDTELNDMNDLNDIELKKYEDLCLIYIYLSFFKIVWL